MRHAPVASGPTRKIWDSNNNGNIITVTTTNIGDNFCELQSSESANWQCAASILNIYIYCLDILYEPSVSYKSHNNKRGPCSTHNHLDELADSHKLARVMSSFSERERGRERKFRKGTRRWARLIQMMMMTSVMAIFLTFFAFSVSLSTPLSLRCTVKVHNTTVCLVCKVVAASG